MGDRNAFLAAIIAAPNDDFARIVYADWLEEHGTGSDQARANLIRLQIEAARLPDDDERRTVIKTKTDELIEQHWQEWTFGFQSERTGSGFYKESFERGFLAYKCLDEEDDLSDPAFEVLLAHEPITHFFLRGIPEAIARWKHLPRIRTLSSNGSNVKAMLRSPLLNGLHAIKGGIVANEDDVALISTDPRFAGLTELNISYSDLGDAAVRMVAHSPILSRLAAFDYSANPTTIASLETIANSPLADRLTYIGLRQYNWSDAPRVGSRASEHLAQFRALQGIDIRGQMIGDEGASILSRSPQMVKLKLLNLGQNGLGVAGMTALLSSPFLTALEEIDLSNNQLGGNWVAAFSHAEVRRLRKLVLEDNRLDTGAAVMLAQTDALGELRELSLSGNPIGDVGAVALARSLRLRHLRKLKLQSCDIGDDGALALADSPTLSNLEGFGGLGLSNNRYGRDTARRLRKRFGYEPSSY